MLLKQQLPRRLEPLHHHFRHSPEELVAELRILLTLLPKPIPAEVNHFRGLKRPSQPLPNVIGEHPGPPEKFTGRRDLEPHRMPIISRGLQRDGSLHHDIEAIGQVAVMENKFISPEPPVSGVLG